MTIFASIACLKGGKLGVYWTKKELIGQGTHVVTKGKKEFAFEQLSGPASNVSLIKNIRVRILLLLIRRI